MIRKRAAQFRLKDFIFFIALQYVIMQFLVSLGSTALSALLNNVFYCSCLLLVTSGIFFIAWASLTFFFRKKGCARDYALISLTPLFFLLVWNSQGTGVSFVAAPVVVSMAIACLVLFLAAEEKALAVIGRHHTTFIIVFTVLYGAALSALIVRQYNTFSVFNPEDFANYNQIFWNTIHGDFFQSSLYGNNFAGHNSPLYFLLIPFYYALPHPLTLMAAKTLLLSLCILPLYSIARHMLPEKPFFLLLFAFLLYPYFISQHFAPPHEICFAPFFLLWAYYFYMKERFARFMLFLMLSLSTKEHVALIAVMFGAYALCAKRSSRWIVAPIVLGVGWGIVSLLIIRHFQKIYHFYDPWLLAGLQQKFLSQSGFSSANITNIYSLKLASPLLSAVGIVPPLLSPISLLGLPEFALNLIADRPDVLSPARHYNIVVSCFLFIATLEGVKKIAHFRWIQNRNPNPASAIIVVSILVLSLTLMHAPTWLWMAASARNTMEGAAIKEALASIPPHASVAVPKKVAVHVSGRANYFFLGQTQYIKDQQRPRPDFILIDENHIPDLGRYDVARTYEMVFKKENIRVYKKVGAM